MLPQFSSKGKRGASPAYQYLLLPSSHEQQQQQQQLHDRERNEHLDATIWIRAGKNPRKQDPVTDSSEKVVFRPDQGLR